MRSPRRRGHSAALLVASVGFSQRAAATGSTVIAITSDTAIATEIVSARSAKSWPSVFFMKMTGMKTITVVSVEAKSAGQTRVAPSSAACAGEAPRSRRWRMLSSTMVAASSVMPTAKAIPAIEMTLSVCPVTSITSTVVSTETGIAMPTSSVERNWRRNSHSTPIARITPATRLPVTRPIAWLMNTEGSKDCSMARPSSASGPSRSSPISAFTSRSVASTSAPDSFRIWIAIAGLLFCTASELRSPRSHRDRRDVGEAHGPPVAPVEHQLAEVVRPVAAGKAQRVLAPAELGEAAGDVVRAAGDADDGRDRDAELRGAVGIELDAQLVRRAGIDVDRADARDRLDARAHQVLDLAPVVLDRAGRARLQLHEEPGQRLVRPAAAVLAERDARRVGVARQRRQLVHARDHVDERAAHVRADRELEVDEGAACIRERLDLLQARQAAQRLLLRLDQLGLDLGGRGRAPAGEDRDDRLVDVREQLHRQADERDEAEHDDEAHADGDADRALQRSFGQVHAGLPARGN